uniref:RRM domain-containing protein n=1 Tax=Triticum urartu TaxID=4572 RepID=A0A8R7Q607_TRIUA
MALSSSSSTLLRRLLGSTPLSSSRSSVLRAAFCSSSSSGPSPTLPPPSTIFGDDTEVANVPPLTTPKLFVSGLSRLTTDEKLKSAFAPFGQLLEGTKACFRNNVSVNVHFHCSLCLACRLVQ